MLTADASKNDVDKKNCFCNISDNNITGNIGVTTYPKQVANSIGLTAFPKLMLRMTLALQHVQN